MTQEKTHREPPKCLFPECKTRPIRIGEFCRKHDKTGMGYADGSLKYRGPNHGLHLYVIVGNLTKRCKIGSSANVWKRLKELQGCSPDELSVWSWAAYCGKYERSVQYAFDKFRLHGEWFSSEATALITEAVAHSNTSSEALSVLAKKYGRRYR